MSEYNFKTKQELYLKSQVQMRFIVTIFLLNFFIANAFAQTTFDDNIRPADAVAANYVPLLHHKRVALIINQTSVVGDSSLLDMLLNRGINVLKIFVPEHGFRGNEDAGAHVDNSTDSATRLPIISLYGNHKKPKPEDLADVDVVVYDLQDVGVRFYTYISTLEYCMEACAENNKQLMVLDRPNPNGFYVDGPVLEPDQKSFVGMQAIPVVYGMTCGEYAGMLAGERLFNKAADVDLKVIKCTHYEHSKKYRLPVAPSPNLKTMTAIYSYPSLCLFEGTQVSVGRGTGRPFEQYGCPEFEGKYTYSFMPVSGPGARKPPYENKTCYGETTGENPEEVLKKLDYKMNLDWLRKAYDAYPDKDKFFTAFFTKLCGTKAIEEMIKKGTDEQTIRDSWKNKIRDFKKIRRKYLFYKDFE
jgi:uncharacterized protein YbbC (DUF1343 family)